MKQGYKLNLRISEELKEILDVELEKRVSGTNVSDLVREALEFRYGKPTKKAPPPEQRMSKKLSSHAVK